MPEALCASHSLLLFSKQNLYESHTDPTEQSLLLQSIHLSNHPSHFSTSCYALQVADAPTVEQVSMLWVSSLLVFLCHLLYHKPLMTSINQVCVMSNSESGLATQQGCVPLVSSSNNNDIVYSWCKRSLKQTTPKQWLKRVHYSLFFRQ